MEWWPFLIFHRGGLRIKVINNTTVLLEACGSAHFWARTLRRLGHDVVLLPPHLVRPYRRGSKNDRADTKALLEAYRNDPIRCSTRCLANVRARISGPMIAL